MGIILLVLVSLLFILNDKSYIESPTELNTIGIESYVEQCLKLTANEAILKNSKRGGYFLLPIYSTTIFQENIPFYYDLGREMVPKNEDFAKEIAEYVDAILPYCLDNFIPFVNDGFSIIVEEPSTTATLNPEKIELTLTLPLKIKQGSSVKEISIFRTSLPAKQLNQNIILARKIVESQDEGEICLTCFSNLAAENDIFVDILPYYNDTLIIELTDNDYLINEEAYNLRFIINYNETK